MFAQELIGEEVEIIQAQNAIQRGWKGKIVDETRSTIVIEHQGEIKKLMKKQVTLKLRKTGKIISGASIAHSSEERIKG